MHERTLVRHVGPDTGQISNVLLERKFVHNICVVLSFVVLSCVVLSCAVLCSATFFNRSHGQAKTDAGI